jgi:hypothetical protein
VVIGLSIRSIKIGSPLKHKHDIIILIVIESTVELRQLPPLSPLHTNEIKATREILDQCTSDFNTTVLSSVK